MTTYAEDALLEWPNGGLGGAVPAGWRSSMQHGSGPEKDRGKDISLFGLTAKELKHYFPIIHSQTYCPITTQAVFCHVYSAKWLTHLRYSRHEIA